MHSTKKSFGVCPFKYELGISTLSPFYDSIAILLYPFAMSHITGNVV